MKVILEAYLDNYWATEEELAQMSRQELLDLISEDWLSLIENAHISFLKDGREICD